jgi:hypothetical protein
VGKPHFGHSARVSRLTMVCLIVGGMLSVFTWILMASSGDEVEGVDTWRERFLRRTRPVWPTLLLLGVVLWLLDR